MILGFQSMKELYSENAEFSSIINNCKWGVQGTYSLQYGFLFKGNQLCVPKSSFHELLIREVHGGGLPGHFSINKTLEVLEEHFYWP